MNILAVTSTDILQDMVALIIPLLILELMLFLYALVHILRHDTYNRGNRTFWLIVILVGIEFIGPIAYLIFGRDND